MSVAAQLLIGGCNVCMGDWIMGKGCSKLARPQGPLTCHYIAVVKYLVSVSLRIYPCSSAVILCAVAGPLPLLCDT